MAVLQGVGRICPPHVCVIQKTPCRIGLNLISPELSIFIVFKMTGIASGDQLFINGLIGNSDETAYSKFITFYRAYSSLRLLISKA